MTSTGTPEPLMDVAIIGGGVSGAYAAYRLTHEDPQQSPVLKEILGRTGRDTLDVRLFEISDRIGGRLWSHTFKGLEDKPAEMGGIAFNAYMENVYGLATKELGLLDVPSLAFVNVQMQHFRDHRFVADSYGKKGFYPGPDANGDAWTIKNSQLPFFLDPSERDIILKWYAQGKPFGALSIVVEGMASVVAGSRDLIDEVTGALWRPKPNTAQAHAKEAELIALLRAGRISNHPTHNGRELHDCGFWDIMTGVLTREAYNLIRQSAGLSSIFRNWNFADAFLELLRMWLFMPITSPNDIPYRTLVGGYQKLPMTLIDRFRKKGGKVRLSHRLQKLSIETYGGEDLIKLEFSPQGAADITLTKYARHVILAMPQRALKRLKRDSVIFDSAIFKGDVNAVSPTASIKLCLVYKEPWWEKVPYKGGKTPTLIEGQSTTDLPLRTCYYMGSAPQQQNGDQMSLLTAALSDDMDANFWSGYCEGAGYGPTFAPYMGRQSDQLDDLLSTPSAMIDEVQRQLTELHGYALPDPVDSAFFNWTEDPFGAAWHLWNPRVKSWEVMPRVRQPLAGVPIYLCGEAYSDQQGWVEGAINTAENVLESHLGLGRPGWVSDTYSFGP